MYSIKNPLLVTPIGAFLWQFLSFILSPVPKYCCETSLRQRRLIVAANVVKSLKFGDILLTWGIERVLTWGVLSPGCHILAPLLRFNTESSHLYLKIPNKFHLAIWASKFSKRRDSYNLFFYIMCSVVFSLEENLQHIICSLEKSNIHCYTLFLIY